MKRIIPIMLMTIFLTSGWALAQSSSLFRAHKQRTARVQRLTTQPAASGALRMNAGTQPPAMRFGVNTLNNQMGPPAQNQNRNGATNPQTGQQNTQNDALAQASFISTPLPQPRVLKVNDLVGVIVRHRYRSRVDARLEQRNEWDIESQLNAWFRIHNSSWEQQQFPTGNPRVAFEHENELRNLGRSDRQDILETRMQGKVIDIKPNGNLIVVASYSIDSDHDNQSLVLAGEIAQRDLGPDNTVTSDKIFGLKIGTAPTGAVQDATKRGWLKELLDVVKPF